MDSEFVKKRLEKDLLELKKMIDAHFEQRKKDEGELTALEERIEKRRDVREKQKAERAQREKDRLERERIEKERKEEEMERKLAEEAEKKKKAMAALNANFGGQRTERKKGRGTDRDKKKKVLAERRKPLNIDHLEIDKLKAKAKELWDHLNQLEKDKFDYERETHDQKYDVNLLRFRVNSLTDQNSKQNSKMARIGKLNR